MEESTTAAIPNDCNTSKYEASDPDGIFEKDNSIDFLSPMKMGGNGSDILIHSESHCLSEMEENPKALYPHLEKEIFSLTQILIEAFDEGNWPVIERLSSKEMSYFGPDTTNTRVPGFNFFRFQYLNNPFGYNKRHLYSLSHISDVDVNILTLNTAFISYTNVVQNRNRGGDLNVTKFFETRLWHRNDDNQWKCVHYHKTEVSKTKQNDKLSLSFIPKSSIGSDIPSRENTLNSWKDKHKNETTTSSYQSLRQCSDLIPKDGCMTMEVDICEEVRTSAIMKGLPTSRRKDPQKRKTKYAEIVSIGSNADG